MTRTRPWPVPSSRIRRPASLRCRLTRGVTVLVTVAVLAAEIITFVGMRYWLLHRMDEVVTTLRLPDSAYRDAADKPGFPSYLNSPGILPPFFQSPSTAPKAASWVTPPARASRPGRPFPPTSTASTTSASARQSRRHCPPPRDTATGGPSYGPDRTV
ncbi:hypothetical protein OK074_1290 [Actinobacteria bacterium OK074]|nr:hypothetical protein OK074_1290 [Actinobacteria bacterium OK074]